MIFAGLLGAAKTEKSLAAGFAGRHAVAHVFVDGEFQMRSHFGVEVGIERRRAEECEETLHGLVEAVDHLWFAAPRARTRPITPARRSQ